MRHTAVLLSLLLLGGVAAANGQNESQPRAFKRALAQKVRFADGMSGMLLLAPAGHILNLRVQQRPGQGTLSGSRVNSRENTEPGVKPDVTTFVARVQRFFQRSGKVSISTKALDQLTVLAMANGDDRGRIQAAVESILRDAAQLAGVKGVVKLHSDLTISVGGRRVPESF